MPDVCNRESFDICKTSLNKVHFVGRATILILQPAPDIHAFDVPSIVPGTTIRTSLDVIYFCLHVFMEIPPKKSWDKD